jgi:hypothetical protein
MPVASAIKITLYSKGDEEKKTHQRLIVPWGFLKRAVRLSKDLTGGDVTEEMIDQVGDLLVEFFGNAFSRAELEAGADVAEIMACFQSIVSKARGLIPNPPPPAS